MLIATICIGDTQVSVCQVQSLAPSDDEMPYTWELHFRDLPSGLAHTLVARGENDALMLFAAWIAIDESALGALEPYRRRLYAVLPKGPHGFLP